MVPQIQCDVEVDGADLTRELVGWIDRCAPFGMGNPEPVFLTRGLRLSAAPRIIKEQHVSLPLGRSVDGRSLNAMGWSRSGQVSWAERVFQMGLIAGSSIDVVYRLRENQHPIYGGLELDLLDVRASSVS